MSADRPLFTIVTIVKNEAHRLPHYLSSEPLQKFIAASGEVLIVDTGSSDETCQIAAAAGCRVEKVEERFARAISMSDVKKIKRIMPKTVANCMQEHKELVVGKTMFDFSSARNSAAELASANYVLQIDVGDFIRALDFAQLNTLIREGCQIQYVHEIGSEISTQMISRFYDRRYFHYVHICHEVVVPKFNTNPNTQGSTRVEKDVLCVRYHRQIAKSRNYIPALAVDILDTRHDFRSWFYLARELFYKSWFQACVDLTSQGLKTCNKPWVEDECCAYILMGKCYIQLKRLDDARDCFWKSVIAFPGRREGWIELAYVAQVQNHPALSKSMAYAALALPRTALLHESEIHYTYIPHDIISFACRQLGQKQEALNHEECGIQLRKDANLKLFFELC